MPSTLKLCAAQTGAGEGILTFRARVLAGALAVVVSVVAAMAMISVFDEFSQVPAVAQWIISIGFVGTVGWRIARVGVVASEDLLVVRNVLKDVRISWQDVTDIRVEEGLGELGRTALPCIETTSGDHEIAWLAGYSFKKPNARVLRQTDALREYWQSRRSETRSEE